jgi:hypothetical protein
MTDNDSIVILDSFLASHLKEIRNVKVIADKDLSELFETNLETIHQLVESNPQQFPDEAMLTLSKDERMVYSDVLYGFSNSGIFALAGLLKTKRAIRIYVKLIELLVSRLQGKAYEIAAAYQVGKS